MPESCSRQPARAAMRRAFEAAPEPKRWLAFDDLIRLTTEVERTRLTDDLALDFTVGEKLVGIEVVGASRLFEKPEAPVIDLKDLQARVA